MRIGLVLALVVASLGAIVSSIVLAGPGVNVPAQESSTTEAPTVHRGANRPGDFRVFPRRSESRVSDRRADGTGERPPKAPVFSREEEPWIGVKVASLNANLARRLGIETESGVVILHVMKESPAEAALKVKDVILAINEETVKLVSQVIQVVHASQPGDTLHFRIQRDRSEMTAPVVVGERMIPGKGRPLRRQPSHTQEISLKHPLVPLLGLLGKRLLNAEVNLVGKEGNSVALSMVTGIVNARDDTSLVVEAGDGSGETTVTVEEGTTIFNGRQQIKLTDVDLGNRVIVLRKDGELQSVRIGGADLLPGLLTKPQARLKPHFQLSTTQQRFSNWFLSGPQRSFRPGFQDTSKRPLDRIQSIQPLLRPNLKAPKFRHPDARAFQRLHDLLRRPR